VHETDSEWILAFDAGCGRCKKVIDEITGVAGDRLAVAGLGEDRIRALRQRTLGAHPPFVPTLLAVDSDGVRAWTGPRMSLRMSLLLGPRRCIAVARQLNRMDVIVHGDRRRFLKAVPGVTLGVFLFSGGVAAPAMAAPGRRSTWAEAKDWATRLDRLPAGYDEFVAHPVIRRRAVFGALPLESKIDLWKEHIKRFRLAHPELSIEQSAVLDDAATLVPNLFSPSADSHAHTELSWFEDRAVAVLGSNNAFAAIAMLGAAEPMRATTGTGTEPAAQECWCNVGSSCSCPNDSRCRRIGRCEGTDSGCGCFWIHDCDGDYCQSE
jgi:hypothetical protein